MTDISICRICLNTEAKLYKYDLYELKEYYEQVTVTKVDENEGLSCHFCYECAAMLHKFHKFKMKCYNGQKVFRDIMKYKVPITISSLHQLRDVEDLQSSLGIIAINKRTKRVKTYIVKAKETSELVKKSDLETISLSDTDEDKCDELVDFEKKIDDDNAVNVYDEMIEVKEENIALDDEITKNEDININDANIDHEKVKLEENLNEVKNINNDDNSSNSELNENVFVDELKISDEKVFAERETVEKKETNTKNSRKKKKFENKKTGMDPKNWLKIILNEEEAVAEFKARSKHDRYVSAKYKCTMCFKSFSKEDMLVRHLKFCHSESIGALECRFCQMRFKMKFRLKDHLMGHYNKYQCLRCDLICPLENTARLHDQYHNGVLRKCEHCDREFKHTTTYYTHLRTHRSEYVCTVCGASFVSTVGLKKHKRIKHLSPDELEVTASVTSEGEEVFCARCDIRFSTKKAYEEHLIHSALHIEGVEDADIDDDVMLCMAKLKKYQARQRNLPTNCYLCGKHFPTYKARRIHHLAEHRRKQFYGPTERQICEICGDSLAPNSIASHLKTHTKEKLYPCATCGKEFHTKTGLNTHQLIHSNVKPAACTLCDKRFKQSSSLKLHYRTFHLKEPYPKRNRKKKTND